MKFKKTIFLIPLFLLAGCNGGEDKPEEIKVSTPKEIIRTDYFDGETSFSKNVYTYDERGNVLVNVYFYMSEETNDYICSGKTVCTYDENNNLLTYLAYDYEEEERLCYKEVSTYENGVLTRSEYYSLDDDDALTMYSYSTDYSYDSLGRCLGYKDYSYDSENNTSTLESETTYKYKNNFMEFSKCELAYTDEEDPFSYIVEREFDEKGLITCEKNYVPNEDYFTYDYYEYTEDGECSSDTYYSYDKETNSFHIECIFYYTYVDKHYKVKTSEVCFDDNGYVSLFDIVDVEYDDENNILSRKCYEFNFETNKYELYAEEAYIY